MEISLLVPLLGLIFSLMMADRLRDPRTGRFVRGGQLDLYPQWMQLPLVIEAAAGTFIESPASPTPVNSATNLVMEILGVEWLMDVSGAQALAADQQTNWDAQITTSTQTGMLSFASAALLDRAKLDMAVIRNDATGVGMMIIDAVVWHDFATSGHGPITAARNFFIAAQSSTNVAPMQVSARILHRLVRVSSEELLGLLQEQVGI